MNGIGSLIRVLRKLASAVFLPSEDTVRNWQLATQKRALTKNLSTLRR